MVLRTASEHPDLVVGIVLVDPVVASECARGGLYDRIFPCDGKQIPLLPALFGWKNERTQPLPKVALTVLRAEDRWTAKGDDAFNLPPGVTSDAAKAKFAAACDAILGSVCRARPGWSSREGAVQPQHRGLLAEHGRQRDPQGRRDGGLN